MSEKELIEEWFRDIPITPNRSYRKLYWENIESLLIKLNQREISVSRSCAKCGREECFAKGRLELDADNCPGYEPKEKEPRTKMVRTCDYFEEGYCSYYKTECRPMCPHKVLVKEEDDD